MFHISNCFTHLGSFRCPCLAWYFIPLTFLYLFLQPGTGQANGLSTSPSLEFCIILQIYNKTCHEQFARNKPKTCSKSKFLWKLIIDRHLPFDIVMYYNSYIRIWRGENKRFLLKYGYYLIQESFRIPRRYVLFAKPGSYFKLILFVVILFYLLFAFTQT